MLRRPTPVCPATSNATRFLELDWRTRPDGRPERFLPEHVLCPGWALSPELKRYSRFASLFLKRAPSGRASGQRLIGSQVTLHFNLPLSVGFDRIAFLRWQRSRHGIAPAKPV